MRDYLFRGKRKDNGEWVEGYFIHYDDTKDNHKDDCDYIVGMNTGENFPLFDVIPETVGQFTGLTAKNGKIFEGDIVQAYDENYDKGFAEVKGKIFFNCGSFDIDDEDVGYIPLYSYGKENIEIIGNIQDNPELLKGGEVK